GDELFQALCRKGQSHRQHVWGASEERDRFEIAHEVVGTLLVERRVCRQRRRRGQQRIAVGRRPRDQLSTYIPRGAWTVVYHELLSQRFAQAGREQPAREIHGRAWGKRGDEPHGPCGVALGARLERDRRKEYR